MRHLGKLREFLDEIPGAMASDWSSSPPTFPDLLRRLNTPILVEDEESDERTADLIRHRIAPRSPAIFHIDVIGRDETPDSTDGVKATDLDFLERQESAVAKHGIEALAWYVTFHQRRVDWGVFIPQSSLWFMAEGVFDGLICSKAEKLSLGFHSLLSHELFHFATDYMSAQLELLLGEACWHPARSLKDAQLQYNLLEEELANAHMLREFQGYQLAESRKGAHELLVDFVRTQPPGYRDGENCIDVSSFVMGLDRLACDYLNATNRKDRPPNGGAPWPSVDLRGLYSLEPQIDWPQCPIYLLDDSSKTGLPPLSDLFIGRLENIEESQKFRKMLAKLDATIAEQWLETRRKLNKTTTSGGLRFAPWKKGGPNCFSVRVNDDIRAHLHLDKRSRRWIADEIGNHKSMGHG